MVRSFFRGIGIWLLKPTPRYYDNIRAYYINRAIHSAICMAVITLGARLLGESHGAFAEYGIIPDLLFNVTAGTLILFLIDLARPKVYV